MREYRDYFFKKAKSENYPARSIYKLKEIDAKYHIFKKGAKVLDLGAAPGSWSLGAAEKIGLKGQVLACDLNPAPVAFPAQVSFIQSDVFNPAPEFLIALTSSTPFDVVMSDMAPATTGTPFTDQARSLELASRAFELACGHLRANGHFIVKIFMGPDIGELLRPMRQRFANVRTFKPRSSRSESRETFFIGLNFKKISDSCTEAS